MRQAAWERFFSWLAPGRNPEPMSGGHRLPPLGGQPWPAELETLHLLTAGTTGAGKSTLIEKLLDGVRARDDRAIVCDPNGGYLRHFARDGDRRLNPFDARSEGWTVFNEMRADFDADRLAASIVPAGHGESAPWHHYAQVLLAEVLRALVRSGEITTERLLHWCTSASARELGALLAGTAAAGLLDEGADKALASMRFVLTAHLSPHRFIKAGGFSLRDWLEREDGSFFLTWRADMQAALAPLLASWADIVTNAVLMLPLDPTRRVWLVLDELAALGKLNGLEAGLTLGRKHGLCVVAGLQSTAQLDRLYGRESAGLCPSPRRKPSGCRCPGLRERIGRGSSRIHVHSFSNDRYPRSCILSAAVRPDNPSQRPDQWRSPCIDATYCGWQAAASSPQPCRHWSAVTPPCRMQQWPPGGAQAPKRIRGDGSWPTRSSRHIRTICSRGWSTCASLTRWCFAWTCSACCPIPTLARARW